MTETCDYCRFWDEQCEPTGDVWGYCRLKAPAIGFFPESAWPKTWANDWCSRWKRRKIEDETMEFVKRIKNTVERADDQG